MNHFYMMMLIVMTWIPVVSADEAGAHLFILSGQSNMVRLDPELSFTPTLEQAFGRERVIVVKDAQGGKPILRWYKGWQRLPGQETMPVGDLYDRLMSKLRAATEGRRIEDVTLIWMQGERDARRDGDRYAASLRGLLQQFRSDLGRPDMYVVVGRISDYDNPRGYPDWEKVRRAQVEVAESDPYAAWVNTDDLNSGLNRRGEVVEDDLHYSVEGYRELGKRFAEKAIGLIRQHAAKPAAKGGDK